MSVTTIPDIKPEINIGRDKSIDLLITAIALEELGLSHIINAEAEKIQFVLGTLDKDNKKESPATMDDLLKINKAVEKVLKKVIKKEMLLEFMLEESVDMEEKPEKDDDKDDDDDDEGD